MPPSGLGSLPLLCRMPWTDAGLRFTERGLQVAELITAGLADQAIARCLPVAPRTAETHVHNIRRKLEVRSRAQIAAGVTGHRLGRVAPG